MSEDFPQDGDPKRRRNFRCRDHLWELYEQMARELGCSIDYLLNEAMSEYARSRDFDPSSTQSRRATGSESPEDPRSRRGRQGGAGSGRGGSDRDHETFKKGVKTVGERSNPDQNRAGGNPRGGSSTPSETSGGPPPPPSPGPGEGSPGGGRNVDRSSQPSSQRREEGAARPQNSQRSRTDRPTVYLVFNNNRYAIDEDQFVIGRGSQNTDLTIRDGNISREHCAVVYRSGDWYLKDLDSTNGVEFRGSRIQSKRIEEGDVFYLCDYPLQFTYRG